MLVSFGSFREDCGRKIKKEKNGSCLAVLGFLAISRHRQVGLAANLQNLNLTNIPDLSKPFGTFKNPINTKMREVNLKKHLQGGPRLADPISYQVCGPLWTRFLTRASGRGKHMNTVHSITRPKGKSIKTDKK